MFVVIFVSCASNPEGEETVHDNLVIEATPNLDPIDVAILRFSWSRSKRNLPRGEPLREDLHPRREQMADKALNELFLDQLKDIYFAEMMIYKTLPKMAKAAKASALKDAFQTHQAQTKEHMARLEQVFEIIGEKAEPKTCEAINGIIAEGEETIEKFGSSDAIDTGLIAAGEAVEHYEMARYGALAAWAKQLKLPEAEKLFNQTRQEEAQTEQLLIKLGQQDADRKAA
jgi:ferritin-like metal-binding protein YciE